MFTEFLLRVAIVALIIVLVFGTCKLFSAATSKHKDVKPIVFVPILFINVVGISLLLIAAMEIGG